MVDRLCNDVETLEIDEKDVIARDKSEANFLLALNDSNIVSPGNDKGNRNISGGSFS